MTWIIVFVVVVLAISFLRNAPIVGPFIFKPLFDLIWFAIAATVLAGILYVAVVMSPEGTFPAPIENFVNNISGQLDSSSYDLDSDWD
ncbi:hypothetical protein [Hirschia maritima]|uniref:hypothetical protein n=1 Tax=Hirschia maritima TaxID=1121961 RepID=UPI0003A11324|nr:hypothetical protein [Hirschia maritima]